jgi:hypothetical protein
VVEGVAFEEVEGVWVFWREGGSEVGGEGGVFFDGVNARASFEEGGRERAEAGADFNDGVGGGDLREREGFADDVSVNEEVLPEKAFRVVAEGGEEFACG